MGTHPPSKKQPIGTALRLSQLPTYLQQYAQQQYTHQVECCGLSFTKTSMRKVIWQDNFINYLNQIIDQFKWAQQLIDLVSMNIRPKTQFFKEVNNLRYQLIPTLKQVITDPAQLQTFKASMKKSVLISTGHAARCLQPFRQQPRISNRISTQGKLKIQFNRFSKAQPRNSISIRMQRSPSISSNISSISRSQYRKSIISFVDDTLSSVFGNQRQVTKQISVNLQIFLRFSMLLQKHLNDPVCMLCQIKNKFIQHIIRTYSDREYASQHMSQLIDGINLFVAVMKEAIIDYYNLNSFNDKPVSSPFIANQENIQSLIYSIIFKQKRFYDTIFAGIVRYTSNKEEQFTKILNNLRGSPPQHFLVRPQLCLNLNFLKDSYGKDPTPQQNTVNSSRSNSELTPSKPYSKCLKIIQQLSLSRTPINKMKIILRCSQAMNQQIQQFYQNKTLGRDKRMLDADQVLAIFCYIIVNSNIAHLHAHLFILDNFATSSQLISVFGYYNSVMNCAVEQLLYNQPMTLNDEL